MNYADGLVRAMQILNCRHASQTFHFTLLQVSRKILLLQKKNCLVSRICMYFSMGKRVWEICTECMFSTNNCCIIFCSTIYQLAVFVNAPVVEPYSMVVKIILTFVCYATAYAVFKVPNGFSLNLECI